VSARREPGPLARALQAAIAGAEAAGAMTALRLAAHRAGWVRATVPQAVEQSIARELGVHRAGEAVGHQAAAELLHLGYGAALGAAAGLLPSSRDRSLLLRGGVLAAAVWGLSLLGMAPLTRLVRPPWEAPARENAVDLAGHALFGLLTVLIADELGRQARRGEPRAGARARVG
jgi:hypothetical protein